MYPGNHIREHCKFTTYRHRFARAAPAPRAKRNDDSKNRGRASPVKREHRRCCARWAMRALPGNMQANRNILSYPTCFPLVRFSLSERL